MSFSHEIDKHEYVTIRYINGTEIVSKAQFGLPQVRLTQETLDKLADTRSSDDHRSSDAQPKTVVNSNTGLSTLQEFEAEALRLGVLTPELKAKLVIVSQRVVPNEGVRRMQYNNLIRNAVKKAKGI